MANVEAMGAGRGLVSARFHEQENTRGYARMTMEALRHTLHDIADSWVGLVAHDTVVSMFQEEFIASAHNRLLSDPDRKATQSQVGLLTGIGPEVVREMLNRCGNGQDNIPHSVEARFLKLWADDPEYRDPRTDKPAKLLIFGAKQTFQGLINRVVRGVTPQDVIKALVASGNVKVVDKHWIRLADPEWIPANSDCIAESEPPAMQRPFIFESSDLEN